MKKILLSILFIALAASAQENYSTAWSGHKYLIVNSQIAGTATPVLKFPVLVLRGEHAPAPTRVIAEGLSEQLRDSRLTVVGGAGHMGPLTHAAEVSALIAAHIRAVGPRTGPATTSPDLPVRALSA